MSYLYVTHLFRPLSHIYRATKTLCMVGLDDIAFCFTWVYLVASLWVLSFVPSYPADLIFEWDTPWSCMGDTLGAHGYILVVFPVLFHLIIRPIQTIFQSLSLTPPPPLSPQQPNIFKPCIFQATSILSLIRYFTVMTVGFVTSCNGPICDVMFGLIL